jgi:hypothetical protein
MGTKKKKEADIEYPFEPLVKLLITLWMMYQ